MRKLVLITILLSLCVSLFAQKSLYLEFKPHFGKIAPHRIGMESLAETYSTGAELNFLIRHQDYTDYNRKYGFPFKGYGISYTNPGNPDVVGYAFAAYAFTEFQFFSYGKFGLHMRVNSGLAYLTKKYDKITNPENIALGTNLCYYFNLGFNFFYHTGPKGWDLRFTPGFIHYSNGSVRKPNLGLNQLYLSLSISKALGEDFESNYKEYSRDHLSKHEFWIKGTFTLSDEYSRAPEGRGGGFPCSTIAMGYNFQYSTIGKIGISHDIFYDSNLHYYFDTNWDTLIVFNEKVSDVVRSGISIGHQLIYNRLELVTFAGVYYYNKVRPGDYFYTRLGLRYYVNDFIFINLTLKAFGFKAHYIEPGIGFSFRKRKD